MNQVLISDLISYRCPQSNIWKTGIVVDATEEWVKVSSSGEIVQLSWSQVAAPF